MIAESLFPDDFYANHCEGHVTNATIDRLIEAHKLVAICFYQCPGRLTPQLTKNYDFPHG